MHIMFTITYDAYQRLNPEPNFNVLTQTIIKMWLDSSSSDRPNEAAKNYCRGNGYLLFLAKGNTTMCWNIFWVFTIFLLLREIHIENKFNFSSRTN